MSDTVIVFGDKTDALVCTEQKHPKDARFLAYQVQRGPHAGAWLSVDPAGAIVFTPTPESLAAFTRATDANYLIADRTAPVFAGGCYRLGYVGGTDPLGPVA